MTRSTRALLTTTAAVTLLGLAGPALAVETASTPLGSADGVRYKKGSTLLKADEPTPMTSGAVAGCDDGWETLGGGQTISGKPGQGISDSWSGQDTYWYTGVWRNPGVETRLNSYAICMKNPPVTSSKVVASNLSPNWMVTKDAFCPQDGTAVGGSVFKTGDAADFTLHSGYPIDSPADDDTVPDDGWRSYVHYSGDGGGADSVHFGVTCVEDLNVEYRSATVSVPSKSALTRKVSCPKGAPVIGGGLFVTGGTTHSHLIASRPWDGKDSGKVPEDGWRGGVANTSGSTLTLTTHAVCLDVPKV